jgi:hypothetical protein
MVLCLGVGHVAVGAQAARERLDEALRHGHVEAALHVHRHLIKILYIICYILYIIYYMLCVIILWTRRSRTPRSSTPGYYMMVFQILMYYITSHYIVSHYIIKQVEAAHEEAERKRGGIYTCI